LKSLSMEHVILIAIMERMLRKGLIKQEDLLEMRQFSMSVLAQFAESTDSKVVSSIHQTSREVGDFFEGYMRAFRKGDSPK